MEYASQITEMLETLICPAFTVESGIITHANQAAQERGAMPSSSVADLISIGAEEYTQYTSGKLCLTLSLHGIPYSAIVTRSGSYHLFCLETEYVKPELRAFALAAQQLREPLAAAISGTEQLLPITGIQEDSDARQQLGQINRSLHQLLRAISNMSDAAQYANCNVAHLQVCELTGIFRETLEKSSSLAAAAQRTLNYTLPKQAVYGPCYQENLERAILNLVSNALKYTPNGGTINATVRQINNKLIFTIQNSGTGIRADVQSNIFSRYLREPGLGDGKDGIGLGMSIVRSVAALHNGTVLMDQPENEGARLTMTIAVKPVSDAVLRTPVMLPVDYTGGRDKALLELADVLPASIYENMD